MRARVLPFVLAGLVLASGGGGASPHNYVGTTGGILVLCDPAALGFDVGGVCIPGGHIQPGPDATAVVSILDDLVTPVGATLCQFIYEDEYVCQPFCGSIVLAAGLNWDPAEPIFVVLDGPVEGNPVLGFCGALYSGGTTGTVVHT